ncbi:Pycsar system effector family protein [Streptomyces sp. NPDC057575]|uniref:Pycsar system effector family protein n=1 Tax=unclassified Streptomyces TaxID=2593676 RepID=UPI0036CE92AE
MARTDTKAGHILTLDGLLVAALGLTGTDLHGTALALAATGAVALIGSIVLAMLVIRPRLKSQDLNDRATYMYYAKADPSEIEASLSADQRLAHLKALGRLTDSEMRMQRLAGDTSLVAVAAIAAAILTR